jgi:4-carboxymuconolactone decarboxylase
MKKEIKKEPTCKLSDEAERNHDMWSAGSSSKLRYTDPELVEIFDNFAFGEVIKDSSLDMKARIMVTLASTIAQNTLGEYKTVLKAAYVNGVSPVEIKEILYQAVAYAGMARIVDFLSVTNKFLTEEGVKLPLPRQSTTSSETRLEKGMELQKSIFGNGIDEMYKNSPEAQLHFQRYLSANCFGDYQTRTGLDKQTRELVTFALLISLGGCEPQVKGHIAGNVAVGNDKQRLIAVVTQLVPYNGYPRTLNALRCLNEVIPEKE